MEGRRSRGVPRSGAGAAGRAPHWDQGAGARTASGGLASAGLQNPGRAGASDVRGSAGKVSESLLTTNAKPEDAPADEPGPGDARPQGEKPGSTRRRRVLLALGGLGMSLLAVVGWVLWASGEDDPVPGWGEVPPEAAEQTREHLAGDGAVLLAMSQFALETAGLLSDGDEAGCEARLETWNAEFGAGQAAELLVPLADPVIGELWANQMMATPTMLHLCVAGAQEESRALAGTIVAGWGAVADRLDELGVDSGEAGPVRSEE